MTASISPNLIIMMHRLGDLIMTLPLMRAMQKLDSSRPLWVVAEPAFYSSLSALVPEIYFLPPNDPLLQQTLFNKVLNISQRKESALLSSLLQYTNFIGQINKEDYLVVEGFWQIYRTSLTQNSKHNLFHWADLHALDTLAQLEREQIEYIEPRKARGKRVGLFLGASSPLKRPEPAFYAELAKNLNKRGFTPFFLGGKSEVEIGQEVANLYGSDEPNYTNKFSLEELALFMQTLDLLITPDTGPMHLAAAIGLQTLTLSLGNVNPYETSVVQPNHYVLQANMSCTSCWDCYRNYQCKESFIPYKVSAIASALLDSRPFPNLKGLSLYKTKRQAGLSTLEPIITKGKSARFLLDGFWKNYFLAISTGSQNFNTTSQLPDNIYQKIQKEKAKLLSAVFLTYKANKPLKENFWLEFPPIIRILASFIQTYLENASYSKDAYIKVLAYIEQV